MEKPTIEKTRRRHPNVDNEILMEKKVTYTLKFIKFPVSGICTHTATSLIIRVQCRCFPGYHIQILFHSLQVFKINIHCTFKWSLSREESCGRHYMIRYSDIALKLAYQPAKVRHIFTYFLHSSCDYILTT